MMASGAANSDSITVQWVQGTRPAGASFEGQLIVGLPPDIHSFAFAEALAQARYFGDHSWAGIHTSFHMNAVAEKSGLHDPGGHRPRSRLGNCVRSEEHTSELQSL